MKTKTKKTDARTRPQVSTVERLRQHMLFQTDDRTPDLYEIDNALDNNVTAWPRSLAFDGR